MPIFFFPPRMSYDQTEMYWRVPNREPAPNTLSIARSFSACCHITDGLYLFAEIYGYFNSPTVPEQVKTASLVLP